MAGSQHTRKDRKQYSFTLHIEEDKDLIDFLEDHAVTRSVKIALRDYMKKKQGNTSNIPGLNLSNNDIAELLSKLQGFKPGNDTEEDDELTKEYEEITRRKADGSGKVGNLKL